MLIESSVAQIPGVHDGGMKSNETSTSNVYDTTPNGSVVVVVMSTKPSQTTQSPEVHAASLRDPGLNSAYWAFIISYAIGSTSVFLLAFFLLNFLRRFDSFTVC